MEFRGQNYVFSNNCQTPFDHEIGGVVYHFQCAEAAFQAERAPSRASEFVGLTGSEAKDLGKKMKKKDVRPDWNDVRTDVMDRVLMDKFSRDDLFAKLWAAGDSITMDVSYPDRYWGLYEGRGQNQMGKSLSRVREALGRKRGLVTTKEAIPCFYKVQKGGIVTFDTETTGVSPRYDDIIQITIAGQNGEILLSTYVKPQNCKEWKEAEEINHISPLMVADAPTADKVADVVRQIFENADMVVGYNVPFDIRMVEARFGVSFEGKQVLDVLPLFRKYAGEYLEKVEGERDKYRLPSGEQVDLKLSSAVKVVLGEREYDEFLGSAHDAEADTLETAKLAKALCEKFGMELTVPKAMGAENFFGIEEGILCNLVNSKGVVGNGFTKRLFDHHPEVKENYKATMKAARKAGREAFGGVTMVKCFEKENVQVANIYAQDKVGNAEMDGGVYADVSKMVELVGKICDKYPSLPVYLPCIMSTNHGDFEIVDAIGCGRSGGNWSEIEWLLASLGKKNLFLVDTTTGRVEKFQRSIESELLMKDEEDFEGLSEEDGLSEDGIEIG